MLSKLRTLGEFIVWKTRRSADTVAVLLVVCAAVFGAALLLTDAPATMAQTTEQKP